MSSINTKQVENRRAVSYGSLDEVAAEARRIAEAEAAGTAHALGNWSPGQNLQHLARFMTCSLDGFPQGLPFPVRVFGFVLRRVLGKRLFASPPPPGYQLPKGLAFVPEDEVSAADGARELCDVIERVKRGDAFIPKSPLLGKMTHEQWVALHLRHAELHMSFVGLDG